MKRLLMILLVVSLALGTVVVVSYTVSAQDASYPKCGDEFESSGSVTGDAREKDAVKSLLIYANTQSRVGALAICGQQPKDCRKLVRVRFVKIHTEVEGKKLKVTMTWVYKCMKQEPD